MKKIIIFLVLVLFSIAGSCLAQVASQKLQQAIDYDTHLWAMLNNDRDAIANRIAAVQADLSSLQSDNEVQAILTNQITINAIPINAINVEGG